MPAWGWALIVVGVAGILAFAAYRVWRTRTLRQRFGPEYDRTLEEAGSRRGAESDLKGRERRRRSFEIVPLSAASRDRYSQQWRTVQGRFVDLPADAVREADVLVAELMRTRGYPMEDFDQRADDVSVDHPAVVADYRAAHDMRIRSDNGRASTEDLRMAMVHYRSLFEELLGARITAMPGDEVRGRRVS